LRLYISDKSYSLLLVKVLGFLLDLLVYSCLSLINEDKVYPFPTLVKQMGKDCLGSIFNRKWFIIPSKAYEKSEQMK